MSLVLNIDAAVMRGDEEMFVRVDHKGETMMIKIIKFKNNMKVVVMAEKSFSIQRTNVPREFSDEEHAG